MRKILGILAIAVLAVGCSDDEPAWKVPAGTMIALTGVESAAQTPKELLALRTQVASQAVNPNFEDFPIEETCPEHPDRGNRDRLFTVKQIVRDTCLMINMRMWFEDPEYPMGYGERSFNNTTQRDTINDRLLMFPTDILRDGKLQTDFIAGHDVVIYLWENVGGWEGYHKRRPTYQTIIAYIPNTVMRRAEKAIHEAYDRGDYKAVYALFDKSYMFIPVTHNEYLRLRSLDQN
ncbi:MAG: hypothetical protein RR522_01430 [Alistipes sp.]